MVKAENTQRAMDAVKKAALFLGHIQKVKTAIDKSMNLLDPIKIALILKDVSKYIWHERW